MGSEDDDDRQFGVSRKIMLAAIGSLLGVVTIIILLHLYARYLLRRQERRRREEARANSQRNRPVLVDEYDSLYGQITVIKSSGLDPLVISSLPTFTYKPNTTTQVGDDRDECSVCLGTITEESTVKLLPNCKHVFHVECIDTWLESHKTCPICRTSAEPKIQEAAEDHEESGSRLQPTAPPVEENESHIGAGQVEKEGGTSASGSGSRFGSFRWMLGRDRSSRRIQSCVDEVSSQDLERQ